MPETVILHVGPHKTGTTALQQMFDERAHVLAANGILYPNSGREGSGHHAVYTACEQGDARELALLAEETRDAKTVLLSSELFSASTISGLVTLRDLFAGAEFRVVYVLRRLPVLWPSHWKEMIKHGLGMSLNTYLGAVGSNCPPNLSTPIQPLAQLRRLLQVFGRSSLVLPIYEARQHDESYGQSFCSDVLELKHDNLHMKTGQANMSSPDWEIELGRLFNAMGVRKISPERRNVIRRRIFDEFARQEPDWLGAFRKAFDAAPALKLTNATPLVAQTQSHILDQYGDLVIDPPETYSTTCQSETRWINSLAMTSDLGMEISRYYQSHLEMTLGFSETA